MNKKLLTTLITTLLFVAFVACSSERATIATIESQSGSSNNQTEELDNDTPLSDAITAETCLINTTDEGECMDCCDSLDADGETRKTCRDACPGYEFSQMNVSRHDFIL